jgi:hypothetical protein
MIKNSLVMIKILGSIIHHTINVRIIVLSIIIKGIEKHSQSIPFIRRTENFTIVISLFGCVPNCLKNWIKISIFNFSKIKQNSLSHQHLFYRGLTLGTQYRSPTNQIPFSLSSRQLLFDSSTMALYEYFPNSLLHSTIK